jgi:hypothetical protein
MSVFRFALIAVVPSLFACATARPVAPAPRPASAVAAAPLNPWEIAWTIHYEPKARTVLAHNWWDTLNLSPRGVAVEVEPLRMPSLSRLELHDSFNR